MPDKVKTPQEEGVMPQETLPTNGTEPPETTPVQPETPSWDKILEQIDSKDLRSHPRIAGIVGDELDKAIKRERQRILEEEGSKAAREAEERLRKLAESDPATFAEHWLSESQKRDIERQLSEVKTKAKNDIATTIGKAYQDLPEWKDLTQEDHEKLARSVIGKADDEVIPTFNQTALSIIAERRAQRLFTEWKDKELPNLKEAIRQEEAAKLLTKTEAPDGAAPKGPPAKVNLQQLVKEGGWAAFDKWYNENVK